MATNELRFQISATEMPHFRRLVQFVHEIEQHANNTDDAYLRWRVQQCRYDLMALMSSNGDED